MQEILSYLIGLLVVTTTCFSAVSTNYCIVLCINNIMLAMQQHKVVSNVICLPFHDKIIAGHLLAGSQIFRLNSFMMALAYKNFSCMHI